MNAEIRRWLFLATGYAWFAQPKEGRIQVARTARLRVRAELERIAADFESAQAEADPARRGALANRALRCLWEVIGRADREEPATDPLSAGIARVRATLPEGPLRLALERNAQADRVAPRVTEFRATSELFLWTLALVDLRSERQRWLEPWLCRGPLAVVLLLAIRLLAGPHQISLGRGVTASSICAHTPDAPYARPRLDRVVDGVESEARLAVCTDNEVHPWIQVDLGEIRVVTRVLVHGRSDCCWGLDDTPLSIQVSDDGERFRTVAVREELIMVDFPWRASIPSTPARYVRIANESNEIKNIVINEIEIYGR